MGVHGLTKDDLATLGRWIEEEVWREDHLMELKASFVSYCAVMFICDRNLLIWWLLESSHELIKLNNIIDHWKIDTIYNLINLYFVCWEWA